MMDCHIECPLTETQSRHDSETGEEFTKGSRAGRGTHILCIVISCVMLTQLDWCNVAWVTIDTLPDVALLEIFDFCLYLDGGMRAWCVLIHVCRKWRNIVFGSPRRLDLQLTCTQRTPVSERLDIWPLLPMEVVDEDLEIWGVYNIVSALEHNDRVCEVGLPNVPRFQLKKVVAAMQQPFPALTRLELGLDNETETAQAVPDSFLGGSTPRLQTLYLYRIPFPGLPKILLSATRLVDLELRRIPHSGYISPEAMVTGLSVMTSLEKLIIEFESPRSRPDRKRRCPPPQPRTVLPVLYQLQFFGFDEYLEDLVARIDTPLLDQLAIIFFHQLIFDTPQWELAQFISRTPRLKIHDEALVFFTDSRVWVSLSQPLDGWLCLGISCRQSDWQLSSLAQLCSSAFIQALIVPAVEHLYIIEGDFFEPHWQDDIENSQWLELLHQFTAVKGLYISWEFTPRMAPALQELIGESVIEVLPVLQTLFLEKAPPSGPVQEPIEQFVAARQRAGHPVAVSRWPNSGKKWTVEMLLLHSLIC